MTTLFLNWQEPKNRRWYAVGRLDKEGEQYVFSYTKEMRQATAAGFSPLLAFPQADRQYKSDQLFPLFDNRILPESRPEYADYLEWLALQRDEVNPFAILARTGGTSASDSLEVFPKPKREENGRFTFHFFTRGLRHQTPEAIQRAEKLEVNDSLLLMPDVQNPYDTSAIALRTPEVSRGDMHLLGYVPRYLSAELKRRSWDDIASAKVTVVRVNPPPAPSHFRVLAQIEIDWPDGLSPFEAEAYAPLASPAAQSTSE